MVLGIDLIDCLDCLDYFDCLHLLAMMKVWVRIYRGALLIPHLPD